MIEIYQPSSTPLLQSTKFQLQFVRIPDVVYFCQKAPIPSVRVASIRQETPFITRKVAGHKLEYDDLEIEFLLEETLNSWNEIHKWMIDYATEKDFNAYKDLDRLSPQSFIHPTLGYPNAYCDATLTVLSSQNTPLNRFIFRDCFPVSLGKINMDTTSSAEETMTCTAAFEFLLMEKIAIPG